METMTVPEALDKLATHGTADQIRDHLMECEITGTRGSPTHCVIAEYLRVETGNAVRVYPGREVGRVAYYSETRGGKTGLPTEVRTLAMRFDEHDYPELET